MQNIFLQIFLIPFVFKASVCIENTKMSKSLEIKLSNNKSNNYLHEPLLVPVTKWKERDCECGVQPTDVGFISPVNTNLKFKNGELPWVVQISAVPKNKPYMDRIHLCTGSLINSLYVITSAECVYQFPKVLLRVELIGFHVRSLKPFNVQKVILHPLYKKGRDHGIALLKLDSYVKLWNTGAIPICLPSLTKRYPKNSTDGVPYVVPHTNIVVKRWYYRKSLDFQLVPLYAQIEVTNLDKENCSNLYPQMLKYKTLCIQPKDPAFVRKFTEKFFCYLEPGAPAMEVSHRFINADKKSMQEKFSLTGVTFLNSGCSDSSERDSNKMDHNALYEVEEYESWIRGNTLDGYYCKY